MGPGCSGEVCSMALFSVSYTVGSVFGDWVLFSKFVLPQAVFLQSVTYPQNTEIPTFEQKLLVYCVPATTLGLVHISAPDTRHHMYVCICAFVCILYLKVSCTHSVYKHTRIHERKATKNIWLARETSYARKHDQNLAISRTLQPDPRSEEHFSAV